MGAHNFSSIFSRLSDHEINFQPKVDMWSNALHTTCSTKDVELTMVVMVMQFF